MSLPAALQRLFSPELEARLVALRRDLHRHPELSWQEERTAARLEGELAATGATQVRRVAGTGLVARIAGHDPQAPVVAIRGDIDALPVEEATGLPFSSERPGVMHACGHDVHAAWAVGAAALLAGSPAAGDVLVLLQPAEEVAGGALALLESGVLEGVATLFGAHVDRRFEVGQVVAQAGPLAAASDLFEISLRGRGAHGARPHEAVDPVVGAAALIQALQTIISRRLAPGEPGVVTVGSIHGGQAANVIPESVTLTGTLRATRAATRELLRGEISRMAGETARLYGLASTVRFFDSTPALVNPEREAAWARAAVTRVLGPEALVPLGALNMAGEDFAYYLERLPGCFLRVGAREAGGEPIPAHSPRFYAAEESVLVGAAVLAEAARTASLALTAAAGKVYSPTSNAG